MSASPAIARENAKRAGRPKGSTTRPQIKDYFTKDDIRKLVIKAKQQAGRGNDNMLKFLLEQIFGKAPQSIEMPGSGEITIKWKS